MKRIVIMTVIITAVLLSAAFLASCNKMPSEGENHSWSEFSAENEKNGKTEFVSRCIDCGKIRKYSASPAKGLEYSDNADGSCTVTGLGSADGEFLYIPAVNEYGKKVTGIAEYAFEAKDEIKYVYIPEGIEKIGSYSFIACCELLSIHLPQSASELGIYTFYECSKLYTLNLPKNISHLGDYLFGGCFSLRGITVPESVERIGVGAFSRCRSMREIILPQGCFELGQYCFDDCTNLENVVLGEIEKLKEGTFSACIRLKTIELPSSVRSIESKAFIGCPSLEAVWLPLGVDYIGVTYGESPFYLCIGKALKVYCQREQPSESWDEGFDICDYIEDTDGEIAMRIEYVYGVSRERFKELTA